MATAAVGDGTRATPVVTGAIDEQIEPSVTAHPRRPRNQRLATPAAHLDHRRAQQPSLPLIEKRLANLYSNPL